MEPATKQDLEEVKQELLKRIDQATQDLRVEMLQRMDEHAASLEESTRDSQTEVLKAFLTYQEGQHIRMRGFEARDVEITQRMDVLERRLQGSSGG